MANKLGTVEVSEELKSGLKHYARLEGERSHNKALEDASKAYIKALQCVIEKDSAIQAEIAKERTPKGSKMTALAS